MCAHRDTAFSALESVKKDDEVDIETSYGTYKYKVSDIKVIEDLNDVSPLNTSDHEELTMILLVICSIVSFIRFVVIEPDSYLNILHKNNTEKKILNL